MFAQERKERILTLLKEKKRVDIHELMETFQVSGATLRSDIRELETMGLLTRTHGGALYKGDVYTPENALNDRKTLHLAQKQAIARRAFSLLVPGEVVLLDSGTTTFELAKVIKDAISLTVVTNDLPIAMELQGSSKVNLIFIGGSVRTNFECTFGTAAVEFLRGINGDKLFLSPNALSLSKGASTPSLEMAGLKKAMIRSAKERYLLCDSSKIGTRAANIFAELSEFKGMVTDDGIRPEDLEGFAAEGLGVWTA